MELLEEVERRKGGMKLKRFNEMIQNHFQEHMLDTMVVMNVIHDLLIEHRITLLTFMLTIFFLTWKIYETSIRTTLSKGKTKLVEMNYPYGYLCMVSIIFELFWEHQLLEGILFRIFFLLLLLMRAYILLMYLFSD